MPALADFLQKYADLTPHKVAIKYHADSGPKCITYSELYQKVIEYTDILKQQGAGPHAPVLLAPKGRSIDSIAWMLAIFEAKATYVPVDPSNQDRLKLIQDEVNPWLIVDEDGIRRGPGFRLGAGSSSQSGAGSSSQSGARSSSQSGARSSSRYSDEDELLAYIMYTSGTTGRPKGVMNSYRVLNRLFANVGKMGMSADDQMLTLAPLPFDASLQEIFQALVNGATLHVLPKDKSHDVRAIRDVIEKERISVLVALPGIASGLEISEGTSIRDMTIMGEQAPSNWREIFGPVPIRRLEYGANECGVRTTNHVVRDGSESSNIGKPVDGAHFLILKEEEGYPGQFVQCKTGEEGTLFVGGDVLAKGYLKSPELTEQKFRRLSFLGKRRKRGNIYAESQDGVRFYNTGDLVKQDKDGDFHWLGRADRQVKISGERIQLDSVEAALNKLSSFEQVRVLPRYAGERVIAMDVYYQAKQPVLKEELDAITKELPALQQITSCPPRFIHYGATFPLTTNGKIDDNALKTKFRAPDSIHESGCEEGDEWGVEAKIKEIWREVLGLEPGAGLQEESFKDLGGSSMLYSVMIDKVERAFNLEELEATPPDITISNLERLVSNLLVEGRSACAGASTPVFWVSSAQNPAQGKRARVMAATGDGPFFSHGLRKVGRYY